MVLTYEVFLQIVGSFRHRDGNADPQATADHLFEKSYMRGNIFPNLTVYTWECLSILDYVFSVPKS